MRRVNSAIATYRIVEFRHSVLPSSKLKIYFSDISLNTTVVAIQVALASINQSGDGKKDDDAPAPAPAP